MYVLYFEWKVYFWSTGNKTVVLDVMNFPSVSSVQNLIKLCNSERYGKCQCLFKSCDIDAIEWYTYTYTT